MSEAAGYDQIRDAVAESGLGLTRIEPERRTLEDLFTDAPPDGTDEAAA